jgi:uncharacterized membrane protein
MNGLAPSTDVCPSCGAELPPSARFCPSCGIPNETGQVPASFRRVEPRMFGVAPPHLLLVVALLALVVSVVLFAAGHWPFALIVLGVAALLLAAFLEAARRRPESAVTRASVDARERARSGWEAWRVRSVAIAEARRVQGALVLLESDRRRVLLDLGTAVHLHDGAAEAAARGLLQDLEAQETVLRTQLEHGLEDAGERIRKAQLPVQETMMVLPPEPAPPPGEATPPQPAVVPEPYPPPNEADPPQPARVPEPGPDQPRPGKDD